MYFCQECLCEVQVTTEGEIIRECGHNEAVVIAPRFATLYGEGGIPVNGDGVQ
jgi:hypothetical protein